MYTEGNDRGGEGKRKDEQDRVSNAPVPQRRVLQEQMFPATTQDSALFD